MFLFYTYGWLLYLVLGLLHVYLYVKDRKAQSVFLAVMFFINTGMPYLIYKGDYGSKFHLEVAMLIWTNIYFIYIVRHIIISSKKSWQIK